MLDTVLRGDYERAETFHEGYGKYTRKDIKARRFDLQKAIDLFEKSGYNKIGSDGIRVNAKGKRLSFKILYAYAAAEKYPDFPDDMLEKAKKNLDSLI